MAFPAAPAYLNSCGSYNSQFDGGFAPAPPAAPVLGASAYIEAGHGGVCQTDQRACSGSNTCNFSTVWSMTNSGVHLDGTTDDYAQTGYFEWYGASCLHYFAEYTDSSGFYHRFISPTCFTAGSYHYFAEIASPESWIGNIAMYVDGTEVFRNTANIYDYWPDDFNVRFSAETKHIESDVPGTYANPVDVLDLRYRSLSGSWNLMWCGMQLLGPHPNRYKFGYGGICYQFWVYTDPLNGY